MHSGGERYVIVHAGVVREGEKTRIETFMEGHETHAGERLQWIVEGVKHKSNFLCQMVSYQGTILGIRFYYKRFYKERRGCKNPSTEIQYWWMSHALVTPRD